MHAHTLLPRSVFSLRRAAKKPSAFRHFPTTTSAAASKPMRLATAIVATVTLIGLGVCWANLAAPAECRMAPMLLRLDAQSETSLRATSGVPCTVAIQTGSATVEDLTVEKSPNYGGLVPRGRTGVVYRSMPGFKGDDDFTVALKGRLAAHEGEMRIKAKVVVR